MNDKIIHWIISPSIQNSFMLDEFILEIYIEMKRYDNLKSQDNLPTYSQCILPLIILKIYKRWWNYHNMIIQWNFFSQNIDVLPISLSMRYNSTTIELHLNVHHKMKFSHSHNSITTRISSSPMHMERQ